MKRTAVVALILLLSNAAFAMRATYAFQSGAHADYNSAEGRISIVDVRGVAQKYFKADADVLLEKDRFEINLQANVSEQNEFGAFIQACFPGTK